MRARFDPLDDSDKVFRLVEVGSVFLPAGARVPAPAWFEPSSAGKAEGTARGRAPGLSVWDSSLTQIEQAVAIRRRDAPLVGLCQERIG